MRGRHWIERGPGLAAWLVTGAMVLGSSCAADLREAVVAAGVDFVGSSTQAVLEALIPVEDMLAAD